MNHKSLPVSLRRGEISWGIRYLLFQLVFLGPTLSVLLSLAGLKNNGLLLDTTYFIINLSAILLIFRSYLIQSLKYGLSHWKKLLIGFLAGFAVYFAVSQGLDALIHLFNPEFYNVNDAGIAEHSRSQFLVTALGAVVLVPLAEETLYRGLIFGAFHTKNPLLAYAVSTFFFAFIHVMGYIGFYPPMQLFLCYVQYLPAGLVLAWSYEYSGSILAPVLIHTAINTAAVFSLR